LEMTAFKPPSEEDQESEANLAKFLTSPENHIYSGVSTTCVDGESICEIDGIMDGFLDIRAQGYTHVMLQSITYHDIMGTAPTQEEQQKIMKSVNEATIKRIRRTRQQ